MVSVMPKYNISFLDDELDTATVYVEKLLGQTEFALSNLKAACKALTDVAELSHLTLKKAFLNYLVEIHSIKRPTSTAVPNECQEPFTSPQSSGMDEFFDAAEALMGDVEDFTLNDTPHDDYSSGSDDEREEEMASSPLLLKAASGLDERDPNVPKRRFILPSKVIGEELALLSILKKSIGQDVGSSSMPISINEPLNAIQKVCEEMYYSDLLDKAVNTENSIDRLILVAAFVVSQYGTSAYMGNRKPLNPLLGETFECLRTDKGKREENS